MQVFLRLSIGTLMIFVFGVTAFTAEFTDTIHSTQKDAINYLYTQGVIGGYADGTFRPQNIINRAELLKILVISTGMAPSAADYHDCFPDVHTEWFAPFVCYAKEQGWINGYADGTFKPDAAVNTAEAIKMIVNVYGYQLMQSSSSSPFDDVDASAWYAPYIRIARNAGILDVTNGKIGVSADMTRGRISGMIERSMKQRESAPHAAAQNTPVILQKFYNTLRRGGGGSGQPASSSATSATSSQTALPSPTITLNDLIKNYGNSPFTLSPTSNSAGAFTYVSSNASVATIIGNTVTIVAAGTTIITVTQAADGSFTSGNTTATLTVNTIAPTIGTFSNISKRMGDIPFSLSAPTSNSNGAITYASGTTGVATIAGSTVTLVSNGTSIITATQTASGSYTSGTKTMTLTVFVGQCQLEEPCFNGGSCENGPVGTFACACGEGFSGVYCEMDNTNCAPDGLFACLNGGTCVPNAAHGECVCAECFGGAQCDQFICS